jgi:PAS domain S-box-containing protein
VPHLTEDRSEPLSFVIGEPPAPTHIVLAVGGAIMAAAAAGQLAFNGLADADVAYALAVAVVGLGMGPRWGAAAASVATGLTLALASGGGAADGHLVQLLGYFALGTLGGTVAERLRGARDSRLRHLAEVVHQTDAAILSVSLPGGLVTSWNPRCEALLGWAAEDVLGRDASFLVVEGLLDQVQADGRTLQRGRRILRETQWATRSGGVVDVSLTAAPLATEAGAIVGASIVAIDMGNEAAAVRALRQAEELFRGAFAHAPAGMAVVSDEAESPGQFLQVNPALARITGFTEEELLATDFEGLLVDGIAGAEREARLLRADGEWIWVQVSSSPILDEEGDATRSVAQIQDITARKAAETVRSRLAAIVADSSDAIVAKDRAGFVTSWNRAAGDLYGYTTEQAIGLHSSKLVPEDLRAGERERFESVLSGQSIPARETQRHTRDGRVLDVSVTISPIRDDNGRIVGASSSARDITREKVAAETLRASEERLRGIVETAGEGIWLLDVEGRTTFANEKLASLFGTEVAAMIGQPYSDFMTDEQSDSARSVLASRHSGVADHHEWPYVRPDGSDGWVLVSGSPMYGSNGDVVGSLAMVTEITDRVEAEQERKAMEAVLHQSQRLESLGELAGGVAHDMNNLLAVITNFADFALDEVADGPGTEELKEIRRASDSAAGLIRQLLLFARQEVTKPEVLDLNVLLDDQQDLLRQVAGAKVEVVTDYADALSRVNADPGMLQQVVMNLVVNARDAMPDGGQVVIATSQIAIQDDELAKGEPRDYVCLRVTDDGVGMTAEVAAHAFDPFFSTKPRGSGTGLGLATVYGIATRFGGHVEIDSEPGAGASFSVYFPAVCAGQGATAESAGKATLVRHPADGTILLVEDDDGVRRAASRILSRGGYSVIAAASPVEALKLAGARPEPLDLLLTDIVMPEMSGPTLASRLQADQPGLAVVFASGFTGAPDQLPAGAHFVSKPFNGPQLLAAVTAAWDSP